MNDALGDMLKLTGGIASALSHPPIRPCSKSVVNGLGISTVFTDDAGYETAIIDASGVAGVVERYESEADAIEGHKRWEQAAEGFNWDDEPITVTEVGYGTTIEPSEVTLERMNPAEEQAFKDAP